MHQFAEATRLFDEENEEDGTWHKIPNEINPPSFFLQIYVKVQENTVRFRMTSLLPYDYDQEKV